MDVKKINAVNVKKILLSKAKHKNRTEEQTQNSRKF